MDMISIRRKLMAQVQSGGGQLPDIYQAVEYIEQTGTQWIDTGIVPTSDLVVQITFMNMQSTGDVIFGFYNQETTAYRFFNPNGNPYFDIPTGQSSTYRTNGSYLNAGVKYKVELKNHYIKNLETGSYWANRTPEPFVAVTRSITLGYYNNIRISKNRWYEILMSNDSGEIFHGVPCYRKSDSVAGLYDLTRMRFLTNQGTGDFLVGADIN